MKIRVKLFVQLGSYLPSPRGPKATDRNEADMDIADGSTAADVFQLLNLPAEYCHLVLINGVFLPPSERTQRKLEDGDHLAAWPPVAGGCDKESIAEGSPKPFVVEKEMGLTHKDFHRALPLAFAGKAFQTSGHRVVLADGCKRLEITIGPERERRIANLRIPATDVRLAFHGYDDDEVAAALKLFDRTFQKGGG